ncbi:family 16 glycosylhydrolase [Cystobacter fuscus]|nr:family 16 glycosylhydrolase [Cystobacter fuscus]
MMRRSRKSVGMQWVVAFLALGLMAGGCKVTEEPPPEPLPQPQPQPDPEPPAPLVVDGQRYSLTWEEDFGGALNGGQPRSFLNTNFWTKENLGVNNEQQAYTNRECPDHPDDWNYCVENGRLSLRARHESLDCVVWKQCTADAECGEGGTCAATKYCVYDQNKNGVSDHEECAPFNGTGNAPHNETSYTSGRIKSDEKVEFRYGYIEFRARMPFAELPAGTTPPNGMWPAIWMLGANSGIEKGGRDDTVGWPMTGEIDIMEYTQIKENPVLYPQNEAMGFNTLWREYPEPGEGAMGAGGWQPNACSSWPNNGDAKCDGDVGGARAIWGGKTIDYHQWHTWGFLWDENGFKIYIDALPQNGGQPVATFSTGDNATEFRQPMFLILNNAVGGDLGCSGWSGRACTSSAQCANGAACENGMCKETPGSCVDIDWAAHGDKAQLEVDYVRWFHRDSGYARAKAAPCQDGNGDGTPDNIIRNCGFEEDYTYHRSDLFFEGGGGLTDIINEGGAHGFVQWVRVDNGGTQPYSVQVRQEGFALQAGTSYQWKVDLKTSAALSVPVKITLAHEPWTTVASFSCDVGTAWTTCSPPPFTVTATDTYKFEIDLGNAGASKTNGIQAYIDNMYLATTANTCQPECTGKLCGDDGCGGACGACAAGTTCGDWGQCVAPK